MIDFRILSKSICSYAKMAFLMSIVGLLISIFIAGLMGLFYYLLFLIGIPSDLFEVTTILIIFFAISCVFIYRDYQNKVIVEKEKKNE